MAKLRKILIASAIVCLCVAALGVCAFADDVTVDKILATSKTEPAVLMDISAISMYSSSEGCSIGGVSWYDASGSSAAGTFKKETYTVEVTVTANDGYVFSPGASGYVYNGAATAAVSADGKSAVLRRTVEPHLYAPVIIKNPGSESADVNGFVSFVVSGMYYDALSWKFVSPDGTKYSRDDMDAKFPAIRLDSDGAARMNIYEVIPELNGWKVYCVFSGPGGSMDSSAAQITVNGVEVSPSPSPTPTPSPTPSPTPTPEPTATPTAEPENTGKVIAIEEHEHQFAQEWTADGNYHWHECGICGSETGKAAHQIEWKLTRKATRDIDGREEGACSVCGYEGVRSVKYAEDGKEVSTGQGVAIGIVAFIAVAVIVLVLMPKPRGKH